MGRKESNQTNKQIKAASNSSVFFCQSPSISICYAFFHTYLYYNVNCSWLEFITFLETGQKNAWVTCPDLKDIPEKLKNQTPVAPSLIDEISSKTRNTLVNKFRMKVNIPIHSREDGKDQESILLITTTVRRHHMGSD